jgi:hypothetical protein
MIQVCVAVEEPANEEEEMAATAVPEVRVCF